jgi:septal ring factor EnvC (AmiA/AmiB activator)
LFQGQRKSTFLLLILFLCTLGATPAPGQGEISREEAEQRLADLKLEIRQLQASLEETRAEFTQEQAELRNIDLEVQESSLRLRRLNEQIGKRRSELTSLEEEQQVYLASLSQSQSQLAHQIVSAYQLGRESRLKLLLNQDSPAKLGRMLAYYDYFSRAQTEQIRDLRLALATLDRMQVEIDAALDRLSSSRESHQQELELIQARREQRQSVVNSISGKISSDEARLTELSRNQSDLEALLERLSGALSDIPSELGQYVSAKDLKGSMPLPVMGRVMHAFGQSRLGGLNWQGWLIEANRGTDVQSIAYGRVAYADWLRGYGLLMIIDHGDDIMSLYGHNESLLYDVGDWIQPGTVISTVGENPGNDQGLYFELRNNGKAVDPAVWLDR